EKEDENRLGNGAAADDTQSLLLLGLMSFAAIAFIGSLLVFFVNKRNPTDEVFADLENDIIDDAAKGLEQPELNEAGTSAFTSPVLDAVTGKTTSEDEHRKAVFSSPVLNADETIEYDENDESIDMPGWTRDVIEAYLGQGWTMEQLKEWYNENS
ncbi:MAG: hypothetical protein VX613_05515, partial [Candidatus Thermoplasmatota archaeon]|nr:hypothetical protein [Candidatus Thermoplasmatota archaeon]